MVDMLFKSYNHVGVSILQLCSWGGCRTPTGCVKHMSKHHADGQSMTGSTKLFLQTTQLRSGAQRCGKDDEHEYRCGSVKSKTRMADTPHHKTCLRK